MAKSFSIFVGGVVILIASVLVVGQNSPGFESPKDPCFSVNITIPPNLDSCQRCVETHVNDKVNCTFTSSSTGPSCTKDKPTATEGIIAVSTNSTECIKNMGPAPPVPPPTPPTTTPTPATTSTTPTTPTTTPTPATTSTTPPSNTSTTTPAPSTSTPAPPPTTTPSPSNSSTTAAPPKPAPASGGGMSFGSFFAGIVFTLCMSGLGYLVYRFYRARIDRNYHTLSTNLI